MSKYALKYIIIEKDYSDASLLSSAKCDPLIIKLLMGHPVVDITEKHYIKKHQGTSWGVRDDKSLSLVVNYLTLSCNCKPY